MKIFVILSLLAFPLANLMPVKKDDDSADLCHGNYCSMFEGICKNGGTCISKGCKGVCKCTKEYTGHNCDTPNTPNTPITTKAPQAPKVPKPKKEKKDERSREKDFSTILSLFRMLSVPRPKDSNDINKALQKKEMPKSKDDKDSVSSQSRQRDSFPPRQEYIQENNQEEPTSNSDKTQKPIVVRKEDESTPKLTESVSESDTQTLSVSKSIETTTQRVSSATKITTTTPRPVPSTTITTTLSSVQRPVYLDTQIPRTLRFKDIRGNSHGLIQSVITTTKEPTFVRTTIKEPVVSEITTKEQRFSESTTVGMTSTVSTSVNNKPIAFSGKTGRLVQNGIRSFPSGLQATTLSPTTVKNGDVTTTAYINKKEKIIDTKPSTTETSIDSVNTLAQIVNAGPNMLSSTTLSNLYVTHTLLTKSRIFVSMPSEVPENSKIEEPLKENASVSIKKNVKQSSSELDFVHSTTTHKSESVSTTTNSNVLVNKTPQSSVVQTTSIKPKTDTEGAGSSIKLSDTTSITSVKRHKKAPKDKNQSSNNIELTTKSTLQESVSVTTPVSNELKIHGKSRTDMSSKS